MTEGHIPGQLTVFSNTTVRTLSCIVFTWYVTTVLHTDDTLPSLFEQLLNLQEK